MLVLQALRRGPQHGYGIAQAIRAGSNEILQIETGSLYPALHRLDRRAEWKTSEHNQRAKYYRLTAAGKKQLSNEHSRWTQMTRAIAALMSPSGNEGK